METIERDDLFFLANELVEHDFPEQSLKYLFKAIEISPLLTEDQQNLLFKAYREIANKYRSALKTFNSVYNAIDVETESQGQAIEVVKQDLSQQLTSLCNEICALINEQLLPSATAPVDKAVYHLVVGDFSRFVGELDIPEADEATEMAHENYNNAKTMAEQCLPVGHPTRLTIDLNYSKLLNDVMDQQAQAIELAQNTFNTAVGAVQQFTDESVKLVAKQILELIKDNATQWATESLS